ncbi:MAG: phosphotransferase family protein [Idiomarina sp.]|nr:phosphotransferase family protein [Idiomarina sp.]
MSHALTEFLNTHLGHDWQVEPLHRGEVNQCWKVTTPARSYFLKHQGNEAHNSINRVEEARLQQALFNAHLCPELVAHNLDYTWVLMGWVAAPTLASSPPPEQMRILGETLARIHQQTPQLPRWSMQDRVNNYIAAVNRYQPAVASAMCAKLSPYKRLLKAWDQGEPVFCHNDLALQHVLLSDPVRVVDWEYAGFGHPWFDVASAVEINQLTPGQESQLCAAYAGVSGVQLGGEDLAPWRELLKVINELWLYAQRVQQIGTLEPQA